MEFIETKKGIYRKSEIKKVYKSEIQLTKEFGKIIHYLVTICFDDISYSEILFLNELERDLEYNKIKEQLLK